MGTKVHLSVESKKNWSGDRIINTFNKKYRNVGLFDEIKLSNQRFEKPSKKKHARTKKIKYLQKINEQIIAGTLKPRNKRLYTNIMEGFKNGQIQVRQRRRK